MTTRCAARDDLHRGATSVRRHAARTGRLRIPGLAGRPVRASERAVQRRRDDRDEPRLPVDGGERRAVAARQLGERQRFGNAGVSDRSQSRVVGRKHAARNDRDPMGGAHRRPERAHQPVGPVHGLRAEHRQRVASVRVELLRRRRRGTLTVGADGGEFRFFVLAEPFMSCVWMAEARDAAFVQWIFPRLQNPLGGDGDFHFIVPANPARTAAPRFSPSATSR